MPDLHGSSDSEPSSDSEIAPQPPQPLPPRAAHRVRDHTPGHPTGFMPTTYANCGLINGPFSVGKMDDPCRNCKALHFKAERRQQDMSLPHGEATYAMCCKHGQIKHAPISHPFPEEIKLILKRLNPPTNPIHAPTPMQPAGPASKTCPRLA